MAESPMILKKVRKWRFGTCRVTLAVCGIVSCQVIAADEQAFMISAGMSRAHVESEVARFRAAVATGACKDILPFVSYPLRVNGLNGQSKFLWNNTSFCRYYAKIFSESGRKIISAQVLDEMPAGWRGLMFGLGEFWLQSKCSPKEGATCSDRRLYMTAVNIPNS